MRLLFPLLIVFLTSCAGYRFQTKENPFAQYGIKSVSVPMFYNHSNFSNVSPMFTREVYRKLLDFKKLKVKSGHVLADAVLIGIILSPKLRKDSVSVLSSKEASNAFGEDSIGSNRKDFSVTSVSEINLSLRVMVIKHPSPAEIEFLQNNISAQALSSKIIFNETIPLKVSYQHKELSGTGTKVLATQNRGIEKQRLNDLAMKAADNFKDMILYAF